jgi:hypothetical protein
MLRLVKICPDCQSRYDDEVETCPRDGEELVDLPDELPRNPPLPEPVAASPADRTSMIDLEAIEARRRKKRPPSEDGGDDEDDAERTPPPDEPLEVDRDATGTLHRSQVRRGKRRKETTRHPGPGEDGGPIEADEAGPTEEDDGEEGSPGEEEGADFPLDRRVNEELTDREMSRSRSRASRSRMSRTQADEPLASATSTTRIRAGTQTGVTRAGTRAGTQLKRAARRRTLSGTQAGFLVLVVVVALVGGIIAVARATAVLTVTTVPPGALVVVDGKEIGASPVQKRVRVGSHAIELALEGYEPFKEVVQVESGGLPFLQPLQRKPPPPPPPPTPAQIADELARTAEQVLKNGELDVARRQLDEALKLVPEHPAALALMPKVEAAIAKREAAAKSAEAAAAREARLRQARVLSEEGRRLYERSQLGPAKEKLYASLRLDPDNPEPHRTLGRIFNREDQVDKVRYHLQRYLDLGGADGDFKVREWLKAHPR